MARKKNKKLLKGERVLRTFILLLIIGNIFGTSFSMEVESIRKKISKQESLNQSLEMKISELASFDNVEGIASLYGLEYNNSNVRTINE